MSLSLSSCTFTGILLLQELHYSCTLNIITKRFFLQLNYYKTTLKSEYFFPYKKTEIISLICITSNSRNIRNDIFLRIKKKIIFPLLRAKIIIFFNKSLWL